MAEKSGKSDSPKVIADVAKPGKTPAQSTSRPIIVGHPKMIQRDPMVTEDKDASETEEAPRPLKMKAEKVIPVPGKTEDQSAPDKKADVPESEPPSEPAKEQPEADEPTENGDTKNTGVVDALMNEVDAKQAAKKQQQDQETKTAEVEKLIASKEYFVPIGQVSRRRSHRLIGFFMLLLMILAVAGLNFAIDAGMIDIGFNALTDVL